MEWSEKKKGWNITLSQVRDKEEGSENCDAAWVPKCILSGGKFHFILVIAESIHFKQKPEYKFRKWVQRFLFCFIDLIPDT